VALEVQENKMKYIKIDDACYAVIDKELDENSGAYLVQCGSAITGSQRQFSFKGDMWFFITKESFDNAESLTEKEYKEMLKNRTKELWKEVANIDVKSNNGAFVLESIYSTSRISYRNEFGLSQLEFMQDFYGPIIESVKNDNLVSTGK
jgi:hypothetical protein